VGNPINVATGNKYQEEHDYVGAGPFPLEYTRRYNSSAYDSVYYGPKYFSNSPQWRGTYDRAVLFNEHPEFPVARVFRNDGRVLQFRPNGAQWVTDGDITERLARLSDGAGNAAGWTVTTRSDEVETYDVTGRLVSVKNRAGIIQSLAYDDMGRLATVSHSFGQQLGIAYDASNRVSTITLPGGSSIQYTYGSYSNLLSVTYSDASSKTYHYEDASHVRALTGITDETQTRFATFGYDDGGKATLSTHAGGADHFSVAYTSSSRSTVTDPLGTVRTLDYAAVLQSAYATAISQNCAGCGSGAKSKTHDVNGNVSTRTDFNNVQTDYSYELARNLGTSRTEAFGTSEARTTTTQWSSAYRLPTQIDEPGTGVSSACSLAAAST
jgi:YD repeat-containing protein